MAKKETMDIVQQQGEYMLKVNQWIMNNIYDPAKYDVYGDYYLDFDKLLENSVISELPHFVFEGVRYDVDLINWAFISEKEIGLRGEAYDSENLGKTPDSPDNVLRDTEFWEQALKCLEENGDKIRDYYREKNNK